MKTRRTIEILIYSLVVILSVLALTMAALSSSYELDTRVVYQGF
jgi:hypothetical protein